MKTKTPKNLELANPNKRMNPIVKEFKRHWELYLMALPAVVLIFIFSYLPLIGLVMAFQNLDLSKGIFSSPWCGLQNFRFLFGTSDAWVITRNTVLYNIVFIAGGLVLSVALALLINEMTSKNLQKILQTIYIMPFFLSMVVVAMIMLGFLDMRNGYVNALLVEQGKDKVYWYNRTDVWWWLLIVVHFWKSIGYSSILYTAVISGISQEFYEAAALDGATRWQQIKYITLPHLRTIMSINLIRSCGNIFRGDFGLFYTVPNNEGALYPVTNVLDTYIYNSLMNSPNIGMSTAAGFYQSIVGFILVITVNQIVKHMDADSAMF